ncbi:MAG: leucyl aminopeptidase [Fuerstiella sp.]|nr:leucyl aminopeptidase [Fuerstiella sp.]
MTERPCFMAISASTTSAHEIAADWLAVLVADTSEIQENVGQIDDVLGGVIRAAMDRGDFHAKPNELLTLYQTSGVAATNIVVVCLGAAAGCDMRGLRQGMLAGLRICCLQKEQSVAMIVDESISENISASQLAETFSDSVVAGPVDADVYKAEIKRHPFLSATLCLPSIDGIERALDTGATVGTACNVVKDLVNRTANDIYPQTFAACAAEIAEDCQLECVILDETHMAAEKMGALLAVARGSEKPPRIVKLMYKGAGSNDETIGIVGKGVTFDSGGYSIKPTDSMISMKADMAGAATALGVISAVATLKLPVNLSVYVGLVENMISGNAYRLGDVVTARNGTTIEIHNTDAEGRLVLADVLSYAVDDGVDAIIDLATLTGACVVALGEEITGVFSNSSALNDRITDAAAATGEFFWPMPMHKHFEPLLKSDVADCKNVGPRWGGAVTAAKFLEKFVGETPWVHLDIAGPAWADSGAAWQDSGGTASCVRTLIEVFRGK